ncbi:DUF1206 domain-containing protein [Frigoribacterium salinisoli]
MTDTTDQARGAAARVQHSRPLRTAARVGYAVNGLLHVLIGVIALGIARGGGGEADQGGALGQLAGHPAGAALLWVIVVGLWGLGLFQLLEAALVRGTDRDDWAERAKEGGKGIAYLAVGVTAFTVARGGSTDSSEQTQTLSARLLGAPGGVALLVVLGLAVVAIGGYFVVKGARQKFREDLVVPGGRQGRVVVGLGVVGYVAKGVVLVLVGALFVVAALQADPSEATGIDGALKALAGVPFGVALLVVVAVGLVAYGVFQFVRARRARL